MTTAPATAAGRAARLAALDGLRGLAAAAIVVHHAWMFDHGDGRSGVMTPLDSFLDELRLGVALFFVLSGYLVYRPFAAAALDGTRRPSFSVYAVRRAARILPAYWLVVAVAFVLLAAIDHRAQATVAQLPIFLAFAQNQFAATHGQLDPPLWSLTVEVSFYVLLPFVAIAAFRVGRGRGAQLGLVAVLAAFGIGFSVLAGALDWPVTVTDSLATMLPVFACGMAVAVLTRGRTVSRRAGGWMIVAAVPLVVFGGWLEVVAFPRNGPLRTVLCDVPAAVGFALIIAALVASPVRGRVLSSWPLRTLGTLSYGMYLWHFVLIYALRAAGLWPSGLAASMALLLAASIACAAVSWLVVERPVVRWAHRAAAPPRAREVGGSASPRDADPPTSQRATGRHNDATSAGVTSATPDTLAAASASASAAGG